MNVAGFNNRNTYIVAIHRHDAVMVERAEFFRLLRRESATGRT